MAYQIIWSPKSEKTFDSVIHYLELKWTERQIKNFVKETERIAYLLSKNPYLFRGSEKKNIHEVLITKHNLLLYEIHKEKKVVVFLSFFDTRQHPKKKTPSSK